jgi:hypothetical protein
MEQAVAFWPPIYALAEATDGVAVGKERRITGRVYMVDPPVKILKSVMFPLAGGGN